MTQPRPRFRPSFLAFTASTALLASACAPPQMTMEEACANPANEIVAENCLEGHPPTEWDINGYGDPSIQGFGTDIAINRGETIEFKVDTDSPDYRIDIYRMGYYGGMGARRVDSFEPAVTLPQIQPDCLRGPIPVLAEGGGIEEWPAPLVDCGNWAVSASWQAPADATSGIYFARLVREDPIEGWVKNDEFEATPLPPTGEDSLWEAPGFHAVMRNPLREARASHIYFVVRDDDGESDLLFQTSDLNWQAYNRYGGHSVYGRLNPERLRLHGGPPRAPKVSYNRPFETRHYRAVNMVFNSEYPLVRWLERNGYDVSYSSGVDTDRRGEELLEHKVFLSVGHDEYWTGQQRRNVEAALAAGIHLGFFGSNDVFWKVRWEPSIDGSEQPYRTFVTYKETQNHRKLDPEEWTGLFRDHRSINPEGPWPENALTGTLFTVNAWRNDPLMVDAEFADLRFWRNTEVALLEPGERYVSIKGILGHEWDSDIDNGFRPPGLFRLSATTIDNLQYCVHPGRGCETGSATHNATMYRHENGALVFDTGTLQWPWGLDAHHDTETGVPPERQNGMDTRVGVDPNGPDLVLQQATLNVFADMGVQPTTIQSDLVPATASTDDVPPTSSFEAPSGPDPESGMMTISGTASDAGGGVVAAVEVSLDGGMTWRPARGRTSWSYAWDPDATGGEVSILSRAVDDSGNLETPGGGG
ncbi:N,N-dimethylformamidase beta subunit family domain-containing protein [Candidatus Palauibacter sp.]|uniref:N,N-dimethylformamidase beta subunit family domain-containing protein n=1 Tax=Candidatus Palauibacter sp. TaxID=3101350 RepID=UPI003B5BE1E2